MTADSAQREPTMEEILASIRRIISEDDKPAEAGADILELSANEPVVVEAKAAAPVAPPPAPPPAPKAAAAAPVVPSAPQIARPAPEELVIPELSQAEPEEEIMIVEQDDEPAPAPAPMAAAPVAAPRPAQQPRAAFDSDALVGEPAATKAAGALGKLMGSMMVQSGVTLDDVVKEMLKPMLKDWLDANLPQLVEIEVQKEIERIRRMAR
jgi:cell pole-organizing protein PopZ